MSQIPSQCQNLADNVNTILRLLDSEQSLRGSYNIAAIGTSRDKAVNPRFEIVFAGTYSAGKSMLINALLGKELLYSGIGHATGRECYVEYADSPEDERVEFTFLSVSEIQQEVKDRCQQLEIGYLDIKEEKSSETILQECENIIKNNKNTEKEEEAKGLKALLEGFKLHREYINDKESKICTTEELNLKNAEEGYEFARRGKNSAILKQINYYCHHQLLEDGNVLVDLPGIDAPVKRDAELTDRKIKDNEISAVICVMKADQEGETETSEQRMIQAIQENSSISNRVFYVFNRIDKTWRDSQLKKALYDLINSNFSDTYRPIHEISALLGFYGIQLKNNNIDNEWGFQSIFNNYKSSIEDNKVDNPAFVLAFLDYCDSDKIPKDQFEIFRSNRKTKKEQYLEILNKHKYKLIEQLIKDSGVEKFKNSITSYLTSEKRPELFKNLIDSLIDVCNDLQDRYREKLNYLQQQPDIIEQSLALEFNHINQKIYDIGNEFYEYIESNTQKLIVNTDEPFRREFDKLNKKIEDGLQKSIQNFSIINACEKACQKYHSVTAPLVTILGEAFYEVSNEVEDILVKESKILIANYFKQLRQNTNKQKYYRELKDLLGNDCNIIQELKLIEEKVIEATKILASAECTFYIIESPNLYDCEDNVWLFQFRETLQEASKSKDIERLKKAEPAIRQMVEIDFRNKFDKTLSINFRLQIVKIIKKSLWQMAKAKQKFIWSQSEVARKNKEKNIEKEAKEKIKKRNDELSKTKTMIKDYNQAIIGINSCLGSMKLSEYNLPVITEYMDVEPEIETMYNSDFLEINQNIDNIEKQEIVTNTNTNINGVLQRPSPPQPHTNNKTELKVGDLLECTVTGVKDFGVFVEFQGKTGLIHKSKISQDFVESCSDIFSKGQIIKAIYLGKHEGKESLSTKELESYKGEMIKEMDNVMEKAEERVKNINKNSLK